MSRVPVTIVSHNPSVSVHLQRLKEIEHEGSVWIKNERAKALDYVEKAFTPKMNEVNDELFKLLHEQGNIPAEITPASHRLTLEHGVLFARPKAKEHDHDDQAAELSAAIASEVLGREVTVDEVKANRVTVPAEAPAK